MPSDDLVIEAGDYITFVGSEDACINMLEASAPQVKKKIDIVKDLKEFRDKYWDHTLPLKEAYEKYLRLFE